MNKKIYEHVCAYNKENGWEETEDSVIETLREENEVWLSNPEKHRWYNKHTKVVCINGMYIGLDCYKVTGDTSISDMGIEFNKKSIKGYEPVEVVTTIYKVKQDHTSCAQDSGFETVS